MRRIIILSIFVSAVALADDYSSQTAVHAHIIERGGIIKVGLCRCRHSERRERIRRLRSWQWWHSQPDV